MGSNPGPRKRDAFITFVAASARRSECRRTYYPKPVRHLFVAAPCALFHRGECRWTY
jgi:hypothetical protein